LNGRKNKKIIFYIGQHYIYDFFYFGGVEIRFQVEASVPFLTWKYKNE